VLTGAAEVSTSLVRVLFGMLMVLPSLTKAAPTTTGAVPVDGTSTSPVPQALPAWLEPCGSPTNAVVPRPRPISQQRLRRQLIGVEEMAIRMIAIAEEIRISYVSVCTADRLLYLTLFRTISIIVLVLPTPTTLVVQVEQLVRCVCVCVCVSVSGH